IRDYKVTGVQTCALPIFGDSSWCLARVWIHLCIPGAQILDSQLLAAFCRYMPGGRHNDPFNCLVKGHTIRRRVIKTQQLLPTVRSEERRVGKEAKGGEGT